MSNEFDITTLGLLDMGKYPLNFNLGVIAGHVDSITSIFSNSNFPDEVKDKIAYDEVRKQIRYVEKLIIDMDKNHADEGFPFSDFGIISSFCNDCTRRIGVIKNLLKMD